MQIRNTCSRYERVTVEGTCVSLGLLILCLSACHSPVPTPPSEYNGIFFPRQKAGGVAMDAILIGQLVEVDGCLHIEAETVKSSITCLAI